MYKCLLWGTSKDLFHNVNLIRWYQDRGIIEVIGVTSNSNLYKSLYKYPFIEKADIKRKDNNHNGKNAFMDIENEIHSMGMDIPTIACSVLSIPDMDIKKYLRIKSNIPTIFANNCWGGLMYHQLRLPFMSPFINMFLRDEDYLKFLTEPHRYIGSKIEIFSSAYNNTLKMEYPVCKCDDIYLHFNHYKSFEDAEGNWNKRCERIKWENLFVMMFTQDPNTAEKFQNLPYENKVCFVPFAMQGNGIVHIIYNNSQNCQFFEIVNGIVTGQYLYFDLLDMLLGKFTKVIT